MLRLLRNTVKVGADVMSLGILFQSLLPATGKARSPTVINLVDGTISAPDDDERSSLRPVSATRFNRYRPLIGRSRYRPISASQTDPLDPLLPILAGEPTRRSLISDRCDRQPDD